MKKQLLITGIVTIFICAGLSGCDSSPQNNNDNSSQAHDYSPQNNSSHQNIVGYWRYQEYQDDVHSIFDLHFCDNGSVYENIRVKGQVRPMESWKNYSISGNKLSTDYNYEEYDFHEEYEFTVSDDHQQLTINGYPNKDKNPVFEWQGLTPPELSQTQITNTDDAKMIFSVINENIMDINSKLDYNTIYDNTRIATGDKGTASVTGSINTDGGGSADASYTWSSIKADYTIDFENYATGEEDGRESWAEMINGIIEYQKEHRSSKWTNSELSDISEYVSLSGSNIQVSFKSGDFFHDGLFIVDEVSFTATRSDDSTSYNVRLSTKSGDTDYWFEY